MTFHIITIFPEAFESYLDSSILKRAIENKIIVVKFYNPRDFTTDKHRKVDDRPYGGGPGMVMYALPIIKVVEKIKKSKPKARVILFSAQGKQFTNLGSRSLSKKHTDIILICGHYEGIDARVTKILKAEEVSIGPYVLTGGELPAMILVDSISRQINGVLGKNESLEEWRIASPEIYTRPEILEYKKKKYRVPKVLLSGDHKKIEEYKAERVHKRIDK
ncbi:MAG: tRNA (guanosine(37)-N1)-methyltransferase TrmD [Candidatus Vogelbacteria bacterium]|nr:tRNA (guanosine(37)-N1)-methyltransferase TrmD [Candidatus Vogelbacteria bacterium]